MQAGDNFRFSLSVTDGDNNPAALDVGYTLTARKNGVVDGTVTMTAVPVVTGEYEISGTVPAGYVTGDTLTVTLSGTVTAGGVTTTVKKAVDYEVENLAPLAAGGTAVASKEEVLAVGSAVTTVNGKVDTLTTNVAALTTALTNGLAAIAAALGTGTATVGTTGGSKYYHTFDDADTDTGTVLNSSDILKVNAGENAHGLGWNLPGVILGTANTATVVITPMNTGQDTPDLSACIPNLVQDGGDLLIRVDWPHPLTDAQLPQGKWYVSVRYTIDGDTDDTSRLLIVRL